MTARFTFFASLVFAAAVLTSGTGCTGGSVRARFDAEPVARNVPIHDAGSEEVCGRSDWKAFAATYGNGMSNDAVAVRPAARLTAGSFVRPIAHSAR